MCKYKRIGYYYCFWRSRATRPKFFFKLSFVDLVRVRLRSYVASIVYDLQGERMRGGGGVVELGATNRRMSFRIYFKLFEGNC